MQQADTPDAALAAAYNATLYEVHAPAGLLLLRIDVPNPQLLAAHQQLHVNCSAFLTAWNPRSVPTPPAQNAAALEQLRQQIAALRLSSWPGWGRDPSGTWQAEESLFVPGLDLPRARELARQFDQHAIVHAQIDAVPRLIWLTQS
ncbi:MAG: DUF3293 domain-containing protein [Steroidobacteraceae bacterium]